VKVGCKNHTKVLKLASNGIGVASPRGEAVQDAREKIYSFEAFTLDLRRGCLRANDREIELRPKSFEVLRYLVENAGRLVAKDQLINTIWPNVIVADEALTRCVSDVRLALGDHEQRIIKTLPRRGYLFTAAVRAIESAPPSAPKQVAANEAFAPSLPPDADRSSPRLEIVDLPDKPSIAVLPFENMSGDPEQEYFADGMVEEIITALSRIRWLFVIARNSSFTYKGRAIDVKQVGRELGVRYVLEGSVRKAGSRMRITGQLIDAISGAHLWADRFDGALSDVFELQDKVAASVAGVIEPALVAAEMVRSAERPTNDLTAHDLYLRALSHAYAHEKDAIVSSLDLIGQAIERDPHYGPALALAAGCHYYLDVNGWSEDRETARDSGIKFARRALRVATDDPYVLAVAAQTLAYFGEDIDAALGLVDRALVLNPSFARGWVVSSWLRLWAGQPELAISHAEIAVRLSPRAGVAAAFMAIGVAHFFTRRLEDATTMLLRALQEEHSGWAANYRFLASCYAHMGRLDDAREAVEKLRGLTKVLVPSAAHWRNPEFREFYLAGLRLAAGERT
jgi:TolB-like protein